MQPCVVYCVLVGAGVSLWAPPAHEEGLVLTDWPTLAGSPARDAVASSGVVSLDLPLWVVDRDENDEPVEILPQSSFVVHDGYGYALAERGLDCVLVKIDLVDGRVVWSALVPPAVGMSWAGPTIDREHRTVILGADFCVLAIDLDSGEEVWRVELPGDAVNSTPVVTDDLDKGDRAFIVDADPLLRSATLSCINVDPFDPDDNPFSPGEIVWQVELGGFGGTTPAYHDGRVFVATSASAMDQPGVIRAFDARSIAPPQPIWEFTNTKPAGFFGGVSVRATDTGTFLYAASYAFAGTTTSANLVKLDADTGDLLWSADCNRSDSIPIALADGTIVLSGGLDGFGTLPTVQIFRDFGGAAVLEWDSSIETWQDLNGNGEIDPGEFLVVGGWNHQPIVTRTPFGPLLYVGAIPTSGSFDSAYTDLYAIDLTQTQHEAASVVVEHFSGAGTNPVIAGGRLLVVGDDGLFAFEVPDLHYDINEDGRIDIDDLYAFEQGKGNLDVDGDGIVGAMDRTRLIAFLRRTERRELLEGRR